jgi:hypothetical protein
VKTGFFVSIREVLNRTEEKRSAMGAQQNANVFPSTNPDLNATFRNT